MEKVLIIVDPQNDFIEGGSLPIDGGKLAITHVADYLMQNEKELSKIFVTIDYHPKEHCSFIPNGGTWPVHCVAGTHGSAVFDTLKTVLHSPGTANKVAYCYKGVNKDTEQYSVFSLDSEKKITNSAGRVLSEELSKFNANFEIIICGLAGDVCVYDTLKDLLVLFPTTNISVLKNGTASLDGGKKLSELVEENNQYVKFI